MEIEKAIAEGCVISSMDPLVVSVLVAYYTEDGEEVQVKFVGEGHKGSIENVEMDFAMAMKDHIIDHGRQLNASVMEVISVGTIGEC